MIKLSSINKSYSNHQVLKNVNIEIGRGEFTVIVGKSGCGKSTLLKILGSFEKPDSGELLMSGNVLRRPSIDRIMVFQDFSQLFPWKSIIENVLTPLKKKHPRLSAGELSSRASQMLSLVGLEGYSAYHPHQLSGGMKQRAAIARAMVTNPDVLLMDEPFASLDAISREELQKLTLSIWEKYSATIVFITHDISEAVLLSTQILLMDTAGGIQRIENPLSLDEKNPDTQAFILFKKKIAGLIK